MANRTCIDGHPMIARNLPVPFKGATLAVMGCIHPLCHSFIGETVREMEHLTYEESQSIQLDLRRSLGYLREVQA